MSTEQIRTSFINKNLFGHNTVLKKTQKYITQLLKNRDFLEFSLLPTSVHVWKQGGS